MRGDRVQVAQAVKRKPFQVVELPDRIAGLKPPRAERRAFDIPARADRDQAEGMLFFIFDHQKAAVCQLLDGGRFVQAGQGQEGGNGVERHGHEGGLRFANSLQRPVKKLQLPCVRGFMKPACARAACE